MLWQLVVGTIFCVITTALQFEHTSSPQHCVDLQCFHSEYSFERLWLRKYLMNEKTLIEELCRDCKQCTAAGYSVCGKPKVLGRNLASLRGRKEDDEETMPTCLCGHSVPASCAPELPPSWYPGYFATVCYASSLKTPAQPLAVNSKKSVPVSVEPFWEEPYWKELALTNLTLMYNYTVKVPEHCDGDVMTKEENGNAVHVCTAQLKIRMSTWTGEEDYDPENSMYDPEYDDLPPEVDFDRDVFVGAKIVNFWYKVTVHRPRQLKNQTESSDLFEEIKTVVESEVLVHDMKIEIFGTGMADSEAYYLSELRAHDESNEQPKTVVQADSQVLQRHPHDYEKECLEHEFRCPYQAKCFHYEKLCDGVDDCGDRSDEINCESEEKQEEEIVSGEEQEEHFEKRPETPCANNEKSKDKTMEMAEDDKNQSVKGFFALKSRTNLARWIIAVAVCVCALLLCTVLCVRRRCIARNKSYPVQTHAQIKQPPSGWAFIFGPNRPGEVKYQKMDI